MKFYEKEIVRIKGSADVGEIIAIVPLYSFHPIRGLKYEEEVCFVEISPERGRIVSLEYLEKLKRISLDEITRSDN